MKILILSMTVGEGHNYAARAMKEYFAAAGAECEVMDTYGYVSPAFARSLNKGYLWATARAKKAYGLGYGIAEKRSIPRHSERMTPAQVVNLPVTVEIRRYIEKTAPDAVVFTHVFVGMMLDSLKQSGKITVPTLGILTDFIFHPYWEDCTDNDYVVIPSEHLRFQGLRKGFREEQLLPLGIPVSPRFAEGEDKAAARASLGLRPDLPAVLLMGGSMGFGRMSDSILALDRLPAEDFQMIAVCGRNEKMHRQIEAIAPGLHHPLLNLGYADNVDRLMDAADCIVTKPGGLTTSEALAKRLPMVIVNPIPGQEMRNAEFLLNSGTAVAANPMCGVEELVYRLLTDPTRRAAMLSCIEPLRRPDSTKHVCDFVMRLAEGKK